MKQNKKVCDAIMIHRVDVDIHTLASPISSTPNRKPSSTPMYYLCVAYTLGPPRPRVDFSGGDPCIRCIFIRH